MKIEAQKTFLIIPDSQPTDLAYLQNFLNQSSSNSNIELIYLSELPAINSDNNYIFFYKFPWEVIESAYYLANIEFINKPDKIYQVWQEDSQKIIDYNSQYNNCYLISLNTFYNDTENSIKNINNKLKSNLSFGNLNISKNASSNIAAKITEICFPDLIKLLEKLDSCALISSNNLWNIQEKLRFNKSDVIQPSISIVIPCFNQGIFLVETILSVEKFAPEDAELIIIDDGSTDNETIQIHHLLRNAGYQIIRQENQGLSATRNNLFRLAKADYILPLDSDNKICENFIQESLEILKSNSEIGIIYGYRKDFGMRNIFVEVRDFCLEQLLNVNFIDACAVIRKQVWIDCQGYDTNVIALEDWELWINAAKANWKFHRLEFQTFEYRVRPNSMITKLEDENLSLKNNQIIFNKHSKFITDSYKKICENYREKIHKSEDLSSKLLLEKTELIKELDNANSLFSDAKNISRIQSLEIQELKCKIQQIENSKSWKITAPLRNFKNALKN